jgi:hypothetical protein
MHLKNGYLDSLHHQMHWHANANDAWLCIYLSTWLRVLRNAWPKSYSFSFAHSTQFGISLSFSDYSFWHFIFLQLVQLITFWVFVASCTFGAMAFSATPWRAAATGLHAVRLMTSTSLYCRSPTAVVEHIGKIDSSSGRDGMFAFTRTILLIRLFNQLLWCAQPHAN